MDIIKNTTIRNKYMDGFERTVPVKYLVVHGTGGGKRAKGLLTWMNNPNQRQQARYRRGVALFHYIIDRHTGNVIEIIDPDRWVYHASIGDMDGGTIGVELVNPNPDNRSAYHRTQYEGLTNLFFYLKQRYPTIENVISHRYAKKVIGGNGNKNCPGNFDWDLFAKMISAERTDTKDCLKV